MTMTQLRYFVSVVEEQSLTRVAELLHISQPAVSSAIRDLEKEFRIQLFFRTHRALTLTAEGAEFYQKAVDLLAHYHAFQDEMLERGQGKRRYIFAMTNNFAPVYLPGLYRHLRAQTPDIILDFQELRVEDMFRRIRNGLLDAACLGHWFSEEEPPDFRMRRVGTFTLKLCIHRDLARFFQETVSPIDLRDLPLALYHHGGTLLANVQREYRRYRLEPNILFAVNQVRTIEELVGQGLAGGFLPEPLAARLPDVKLYRFEGLQDIPAYLIWKKESDTSKQMIRRISAWFQSLDKNDAGTTKR